MADVNIADLTRAVDKFTPTGDTAADRLALETYEVQLSALDDGITAAAMAPATAPPHAHDAARTSASSRSATPTDAPSSRSAVLLRAGSDGDGRLPFSP